MKTSRQLFYTFSLLLVSSFAYASQAHTPEEVNGKVIDVKSGQPVAGAVVKVQELSLYALTDAKGGFSIDLPNGVYTVELSAYTYYNRSSKINTQAQKDVQLYLAPKSEIYYEVEATSTMDKFSEVLKYIFLHKS